MAREYCYKVIFSASHILYIGCVFGKYHVMATDDKHSFNYSVYGGYSRLGDAERRLLKCEKETPLSGVGIRTLWYMSKENLHKLGAFHNE